MADIEVGADIASLIREVNRATKEFIDLEKAIKGSVQVITQLDGKGNTTGIQLKKMSQAGDLVTRSIAEVDGVLKDLGATITRTGAGYKKFSIDTLRAAKSNGTLTREMERQLKVIEKTEQAERKRTVAGNITGIRNASPLANPQVQKFGDINQIKRAEAALKRLQTILGSNVGASRAARLAFTTTGAEADRAFNQLSSAAKIAFREVQEATAKVLTPQQRLRAELAKTREEVAKNQAVRNAAAAKNVALLEKEFALRKKVREAETKAIANQNRARKFASNVRGTISTDTVRRADPAQIRATETAIRSLAIATSGSASASKDAQLALNNLTNKGMNAYNRLSPKTQGLVRALEREMRTLRAPIDAAQERLALLVARGTQLGIVQAAVAGLAAEFERLNPNAEAAQTERFNASLLKLQNSMVKAGTSTRVFNSALDKIKRGATNFTTAEAKIVDSLRRVRREMKLTKEESNRTTQQMGLGFNLIGRIIIGGGISRGFFAITSAMRESVTAAKDYSIAIAEIETLSRENLLTTEEWSASVFELSEQFNRTAQDVAEGVYQTLSNQVAQGAEAFTFMETALNLSLATISSAEESVNALTGVINAFDLETREAGRVASQFFKIVELGRTRLGELSTTMGRVNIVAAQLGVQFEEVGAFIATSTIGGVKTSEALTQLRNVFLKLLKPTDALKERLQSLGFETGAQLIEARGFVGVFDLLNKVIREEGITAVTEMFGRVRAITGALQAGGDGAATFRKALEEMSSGLDTSSEAAAKVQQSLGDRFARQLQQASNFFQEEFGKKFIKVFVELVDAAGGARDALRIFFRALESGAIVGGAVLFAKLTTAIFATKVATDAAAVSMTKFARAKAVASSPAGIFILVIALAELARVLNDVWIDAGEESEIYFAGIKKSLEEQKKDFEKQQGLITGSIRKSAQESTRVWFASIAETRKVLFSLQDELKTRNKEITSALNDAIKETGAAAKKLVKEPADQIKKLTSSIETAAERIKQITQTTEGKIFEKSLSDAKDINDTISRIQTRVDSLREESLVAALTGDEGTVIRKFAQIDSLLERQANSVLKFNKEQEGSTEKLADLRLKLLQLESQRASKNKKKKEVRFDSSKSRKEQRLEETKLGIQLQVNARSQVKVTEEIRKQEVLQATQLKNGTTFLNIQEQRTKSTENEGVALREIKKQKEDALGKETKLLALRKAQAKEFFASLKQLETVESEFKSAIEDGTDAAEARNKALAKIQAVRNASELFGQDLGGRLELEKQLLQKEKNIKERSLLDFENKQADVREKAGRASIKQAEADIAAQQKVLDVEKEQETLAKERFANTRKALGTAIDELIRLDTKQRASSVSGLGSGSARALLEASKDLETGKGAFTSGGAIGIALSNINKVGNAIAGVVKSTDANFNKAADNAEEVIKRYRKLQQEIAEQSTGKDASGIDPSLLQRRDLATVALDQLKILRGLQASRLAQATGLATVTKEFKEQAEAQKAATTAVEEQSKALVKNTDIMKNFSARAAKAAEDEKRSLQRLLATEAATTRAIRRSKEVPISPVTAATRRIGFAKGGMAMGTDTVPAMLTPGEFIVNRRATRDFLPTLRAINSGNIRPKRFQQGGEVGGDSIDVGGVTINEAAGTSVDEARLVTLLKRAIFKGKIKL